MASTPWGNPPRFSAGRDTSEVSGDMHPAEAVWWKGVFQGTDGAPDPQPLPCPRHSPSTSLDLGGSPCSPQGSLLG